MKVLISGSTGFLGSALSRRLSVQYQVIPITQDQLYQPALLTELINKTKPKYIFHLASYGNHYNQKDAKKTLFANVIGSFNLFEAAKDVEKIFSFSSSSVYLPQQTMYSTTKLMAEELSNLYHNIAIVRPFSVYGEGEADFRFIPTVCKALYFRGELNLDPTAVHDWIYIQDFIDILLDNLDKNDLDIGTGIKTSNEEVVKKLVTISGQTCKINRTEGMRSYDNQFWHSTKGFKTRHSLDMGLLKTYQYYERLFKN